MRGSNSKKLIVAAAVAVSLVSPAAPALAQASDSYKFLKAVRERDGNIVDTMLATPNAVLLNAKDREKGETALHIVTSQRNLSWLRYLISKGARIDLQNKEGSTPLAVAAQLGWLEGAEQLAARKANVNLGNVRGETPLILAVHRRDLAMVRLLLANGANAKKTDRIAGLSALDYARRDPRAAIILRALDAPVASGKAIQGPS